MSADVGACGQPARATFGGLEIRQQGPLRRILQLDPPAVSGGVDKVGEHEKRSGQIWASSNELGQLAVPMAPGRLRILARKDQMIAFAAANAVPRPTHAFARLGRRHPLGPNAHRKEALMLETPSADPAHAAPIPAPAAPEGADLLVLGKPHDEAFWDQHPDVERYKVTMKAGQAQVEDWEVLVWLKPGQEGATGVAERGEVPDRPADATFEVHAAHDLSFFARHPQIAAWRAAIALNEHGPGAVHTVEVWMRPARSANGLQG
jgi:hypothetical protein